MSGTKRETSLLAQEGSGKPYLGDPEVVAGLVGEFIGGIFQRAAAAARATAAGDLKAVATAAAEDQAAAKALIEVMAGRDPAFTPMGGWNALAEGGLRSWLRAVLRDEAHPDMLARPDGPFEAAAGYLLLRAYAALGELRDGKSEDELRQDAEAIIADGTRMLLGLPTDAALEDAAGPA